VENNLKHEFGVENARITLLGTGTSQGVPIIGCDCEVCQSIDSRDKRLRTSVLVEIGDSKVVVDSGPDFRNQMLRAGVKRLDAIVFTHEHKDHVAGTDDIRAFNFINQRPLDIYANKAVEEALKRDFFYAFDPKIKGGVPKMNIMSIDKKKFMVGGNAWLPLPVMHGKMEVLGFRIGDFAYITDVKYISEETFSKIEGVKVLIISALRKFEHPTHMALHEVLEVIERVNPDAAYLTHMSHLMGKHAELELELPKGVKPGFDGLVIESFDK